MRTIRSNLFLWAMVVALAIVGYDASAKQVSPQQAISVAREFVEGNGKHLSAQQPLSVAWDSRALRGAITTAATDVPTFYVVELSECEGFVVVAGDDAVAPILAYSFTHPAPSVDERYTNVSAWFGYVDKAIRAVRNSGAATNSDWLNVSSTRAGSTVIETALWSQYEPYNLQCPVVSTGQCITGCTQTAAAIIMYHHRWPLAATGSTYSYTTASYGYAISERDINHAYDWDNMLFSYNEGYNDTQAEAVATLMSDLGHAFQADYGVDATGSLPNCTALSENFGYNPNVTFTQRSHFSNDEWHAMLRASIDADRPVFYSGYNEAYDEGHAFVVDGYTDADYFHINWGWGGMYNGYFLLDNLCPYGSDFSYEQWMLSNFTPYRGGDAEGQLMMYPPGMVLGGEDEPTPDTPFTLSSVTVCNVGSTTFSGDIALAHTDSEGNIKEIVSEIFTIGELQSMYSMRVDNVECLIQMPVSSNDRLRYFYRTSEGGSWYVIMPYMGPCVWEFVLDEDEQTTIGESTSVNYNKLTHTLSISHSPSVSISVYVDGASHTAGVNYQTGVLTLDTTKLLGKSCTIRLKRGDEVKEFTVDIKPYE